MITRSTLTLCASAALLLACRMTLATAPPTGPSPADVGAIIESYQSQHSAWVRKVTQTPPEERAALLAERPDKTAVARRLAALADEAGSSEAGFLAWAWTYMECEDEAWRDRALSALLASWAERPEIVNVLPALERDEHARARAALDRLAGETNVESVSLAASVTLASWLVRFDPDHGTDRAIELLERVAATDNASPHPEGGTLAETARSRLFAIRHLAVGATVPDVAGADLTGAPFKLSDYRGRVTLLTFWAHWCQGCMVQAEYEREFIAALRDRPFVMLGVNCDPSPPAQVLAMNRKKDVSWRSFRNDAGNSTFGSIARRWNVRTLPTTYLIGHDGVIVAKWDSKIAHRDELRGALERALQRADAARSAPDGKDSPDS